MDARQPHRMLAMLRVKKSPMKIVACLVLTLTAACSGGQRHVNSDGDGLSGSVTPPPTTTTVSVTTLVEIPGQENPISVTTPKPTTEIPVSVTTPKLTTVSAPPSDNSFCLYLDSMSSTHSDGSFRDWYYRVSDELARAEPIAPPDLKEAVADLRATFAKVRPGMDDEQFRDYGAWERWLISVDEEDVWTRGVNATNRLVEYLNHECVFD